MLEFGVFNKAELSRRPQDDAQPVRGGALLFFWVKILDLARFSRRFPVVRFS
jgi:hypothetical protein